MGAVIQRIVTFPSFKLEYLSRDEKAGNGNAEPILEWSERLHDAIIFQVHGRADERAMELRAELDKWRHPEFEQHRRYLLFACVIEGSKPRPAVLRRDRDNAPTDFVMPPPRPSQRKTKQERERARQEEMRRDDLQKLEEIEVYS